MKKYLICKMFHVEHFKIMSYLFDVKYSKVFINSSY